MVVTPQERWEEARAIFLPHLLPLFRLSFAHLRGKGRTGLSTTDTNLPVDSLFPLGWSVHLHPSVDGHNDCEWQRKLERVEQFKVVPPIELAVRDLATGRSRAQLSSFWGVRGKVMGCVE